MTEPTTWTMKGFCNHFRFVHEKMHDHAFAWVLGAGASRSSGIPTGGELVNAWLHELHQRLDKENLPLEQWATEQNLGIKGFKLADAASFYPRIYERRFREHPDEGYAYLEEFMAGKDPSPGYSILAKTMEGTRHRVVITTNFDSLVSDALAIYTDTFPFVVGHEALTGFVRAAMRRPLVCKIHRDLLLGPKNDPRSLKRLHDAWAVALRSLLAHNTPIFIGYGGNDDSLMDLLESLEPGDIKGQLVWCYYEKDLPSARIKELVVQHRGVLVPVPDFDLFMILLGSVLGIEPLDEVIEVRARKRTANYRERILGLDTTGHPDVALALSSTLERAGGWWAWEARAHKEKDLEKREAIYRQGIQKFPKAFQLYHNFAMFMAYDCKKIADAETLFKKALEINPGEVLLHVSFGNFKADMQKEPDVAGKLLRRALELEPDSTDAMCGLAALLTDTQENPAEADSLFQKVLKIEPEEQLNYANYAEFLIAQRRISEARMVTQRAWDLGMSDLQISAALLLYTALMDRVENGDDSQALGRLKSLLRKDFERDPWNYDGLRGFIQKEFSGEECEMYSLLMNVISDGREASRLDSYARWRAISAESIDPSLTGGRNRAGGRRPRKR